jgi:hypothetical protein
MHGGSGCSLLCTAPTLCVADGHSSATPLKIHMKLQTFFKKIFFLGEAFFTLCAALQFYKHFVLPSLLFKPEIRSGIGSSTLGTSCGSQDVQGSNPLAATFDLALLYG